MTFRSKQQKSTNELLGFCSGIVADDKLCIKEVEHLKKLIAQTPAENTSPIFNLISAKIEKIEKSNSQDKELDDLKKFLADLSGGDFELGECKKSSKIGFDEVSPLVLTDKEFVLTGKFSHFDRAELGKLIVNLGGKPQKSVTRLTDYVIIGSYATDSWANGSYGSKIETAIKYKEKYNRLKILSEEFIVKTLSL